MKFRENLKKKFFKKEDKFLEVKIVNKSKHPLPSYKTELSAGMDLIANLEESYFLKSLERKLILTGLYLEIPEGYEAQIRARSGLALKKGIGVLNSPGTIDADYRGEIGIILINLSDKEVLIKDGDRIAQIIIAPCLQAKWKPVEILEETMRGKKGFGSTGLN
ncbi:MAG: deoxyuridine 5'-triphosphate nucleotidohydrolase [Bacteroidetes bacterium 4572_128]|nr:MAG: deoxyuridine 5'-triphosphate nucleotidohydrolase [Bacteroidetes bacterium 4572_128]